MSAETSPRTSNDPTGANQGGRVMGARELARAGAPAADASQILQVAYALLKGGGEAWAGSGAARAHGEGPDGATPRSGGSGAVTDGVEPLGPPLAHGSEAPVHLRASCRSCGIRTEIVGVQLDPTQRVFCGSCRAPIGTVAELVDGWRSA